MVSKQASSMSTVVTDSEVSYVVIDIKAIWICGISAGGCMSCMLYGVTSECWPLWRGCIIDTLAQIDYVSSILPLLGPWISWTFHFCWSSAVIHQHRHQLKMKGYETEDSFRQMKLHPPTECTRFPLKIISDQHFGCLAHMIQKKWRLKSLLHSESIWNIWGCWFSLLLSGPEDSLNDNGHVRQQLPHLALGRDKCGGVNF